MTEINKAIWKVGHVLSRNKLIDAACQMRDISQIWDNDRKCGTSRANNLIDNLYFKDKLIDKPLWTSLKQEVEKAKQLGAKVQADANAKGG